MKKITILILTVLTLSNCRSRKKIKEITQTKSELIFNRNFDSISIKKDSIVGIKEQKKTEVKTVNENNGDIIIKGKTDSITPFEYHNVVNGDTLSSVLIKGNADFQINNHWNKKDVKKESNTVEKNINIIAKVARTAVSDETIEKAANEIKRVNTEVKSTGFPVSIYIIALIVFILFILMLFLRGQISGYVPNFIKNLFKNKKNG